LDRAPGRRSCAAPGDLLPVSAPAEDAANGFVGLGGFDYARFADTGPRPRSTIGRLQPGQRTAGIACPCILYLNQAMTGGDR